MSNKSAYIQGRDDIFNSCLHGEKTNYGIHNHQFNLVSANLFKFLPELSFNQHQLTFREIILHNRLSHFEQLHMETFDYVTCDNLTTSYFKLLREKPCILSTFHFGSYRLFNTFLIKNKIPYTIVIPKDILAREGDTLRKIYANGNLQNDAKFIEVESPALGLKILRELKSGRSIFIYFDGYRSGGNANAHRDSNEDKINFLGQSIFSKKGVTYLAKAARVPLVTAISYRRSPDDIRLHFFDPVYTDQTKDNEKFSHETTQAIFNFFSPFLKKYPGQWESWLYLHKQIDCNDMPSIAVDKTVTTTDVAAFEKFSFNPTQYGLFKIKDDTFIFNKISYSTYPLEFSVYDMLVKSADNFIEKKQIANKNILQQLFANNVLIPFQRSGSL